MDLASHFGAHPELFGPLYLLAMLSAYVTSAVVGYRRGWPPAAWLLVLAAAGLGGVVGTRMLPLGLEGLQALLADGAMPDAPDRRLPGTILGALAAAELTRRALGVRSSVLDPLVSGGLVALLVARAGCLVAGCCFGTPTDLPWGITYADGSVVHGFHLVHDLAEAGRTVPVHPVPLYDIAFAAVGLALLPWASRRLRAPGSLCGVAVTAYALHRVAQEAVRADAVVWAWGLTSMQVGMAAVGAFAVAAVVVAERRARGGETGAWAEPAAWRLVGALAAVVAGWGALGGWLTPGESAVLLVRLVPAAVAVGLVALRASSAPQVRWTAAAVAASVPLVVGFQAEAASEPFTLYAVEGHLASGRYEDADVCSTDLYDYTKGGAALATVRVDLDREVTREIGVRGFVASQRLSAGGSGADGESVLGVAPYVSYEGKNAGITATLLAGDLALFDGTRGSSVIPALGFRLGPRGSHLQAGVADGSLFGPPAGAFHIGAGTGRLTASGQELRLQGGATDAGLYVSGTLPVSPNVLIEPMGALSPPRGDGQGLYQIGARVRVQLRAR